MEPPVVFRALVRFFVSLEAGQSCKILRLDRLDPMMPRQKPKRVGARARLARRIRILRIERQWSQEVLGELSGLHRSYIGSVERAERNISLNNIEKIANALEVPLHDLLCTPGE